MDRHARIYVAGGTTLIGAALFRRLRANGFENLVGVPPRTPDVRSTAEVDDFFRRTRPEFVLFAAGHSGGILENRRIPADLMIDNLRSATNVIEAACRYGVSKLLYLASSCCYPRDCPQPMQVESLETGPLEPTNQAYAAAKLAGINLCRAFVQQYSAPFICGIPANVFGIDDDFDLEHGHVIPSLMARMHAAKVSHVSEVTAWGTGTPRREFMFADDLADACLFVMREYNNTHAPINLGGGTEFSIGEITELIREVVGYTGEILFDSSKPDGMPLKALDSSVLMSMGWQPSTSLESALHLTYEAFLRSYANQTQAERHVRISL